MFGNADEDIGFFYAGTSIVDTWRVDDHDGLSLNPGFADADLASARVETFADLLLLRRDEVDELLVGSQS